MEQSNWDPRLDTGTGNGRPAPKKGACEQCEFKGDATATVKHAVATGHSVTYNGVRQVMKL